MKGREGPRASGALFDLLRAVIFGPSLFLSDDSGNRSILFCPRRHRIRPGSVCGCARCTGTKSIHPYRLAALGTSFAKSLPRKSYNAFQKLPASRKKQKPSQSSITGVGRSAEA